LKKILGEGKIFHVFGEAELISENGYTSKINPWLQCNSHKNSNVIFCRNRKINPKIHTVAQKTPITKAILSLKSDTGIITVSDFKLCYRTIVTKTT
jgi:hypothetical protein